MKARTEKQYNESYTNKNKRKTGRVRGKGSGLLKEAPH